MLIRAVLLTVALSLVTVQGIYAAEEYTPKVGQPGKDVIWVPTPDALVERMLDMAKATPRDFVIDLGSGDGRTVIAAAKRGINALGIEYNPDMVALSIRNAEREGVAARAKFVHGDVFATDFGKASVLTMYLLSSLNLKLRPTILNMKPGTRVVSHAFNMGDWAADETATADGYTAYMWIVPAKVQGRWQVSGPSGPFELILEQSFQKFTGRAQGTGLNPNVADPLLEGDAISFSLIDTGGRILNFRGKVNGNGMEGTANSSGGPAVKWAARRAG
jgi:SAM-dependent methyltransferase